MDEISSALCCCCCCWSGDVDVEPPKDRDRNDESTFLEQQRRLSNSWVVLGVNNKLVIIRLLLKLEGSCCAPSCLFRDETSEEDPKTIFSTN